MSEETINTPIRDPALQQSFALRKLLNVIASLERQKEELDKQITELKRAARNLRDSGVTTD